MSAGDIYKVTFQWELFGYALMNTFHFESSAGWNTAAEVADEMATNFNDQWRQWHIDEQRLRMVHVKRLVPTIDEYVWLGTFPYFHGARSDHVSDPRLAATMVFHTALHGPTRRKRIFYGALNDTMMDFGKVNENAHSNLDGLIVWLFANYGNPGTKFLHLGVYSRVSIGGGGGDPYYPFELCTQGYTSFRIAHVHSRRTGKGI